MSALELIDEIERLELDLSIHRRYRDFALQGEYEINEYLIEQTERKLGNLNKLAHYSR